MGAATDPPPTQKVCDVLSTFRPTRLFKSPGLHYTSIDFDDTGELVLLSRTDDTIQLYNTKAGAHAKELNSKKYGCALARFSHQANSVVYASTKGDHALRYLSTHDNSYIRYFRGHTDRVTSLTFCPGTDNFLSASLDNTAKVWDVRSTSPQGSLNLFGATLTAYDPSATVIAIASPATQSIVLYDLRNYDKPPFATFDMLADEQRYASDTQRPSRWTTLEFSNNGKYLLLGTAGQGHYLLDAFEGSLKAFLHRPAGPPPFPAEVNAKDGAKEHPAASLQGDCCFSPDGRYVISASGNAGLVAWDTMLCEDKSFASSKMMLPVTELPGPKTATVLGYNPRFNMLASAGSDVMLWLPDPDLA